jgi:hypothetical protein
MSRKWRKAIERYLEICLKRFLNFEYSIELKEPVILLFLEDQGTKSKKVHSIDTN